MIILPAPLALSTGILISTLDFKVGALLRGRQDYKYQGSILEESITDCANIVAQRQSVHVAGRIPGRRSRLGESTPVVKSLGVVPRH